MLKFTKYRNMQIAILFVILFSIFDIYKIGYVQISNYESRLILLTLLMVLFTFIYKLLNRYNISTRKNRIIFPSIFLAIQIIYEVYALILVLAHKTSFTLISSNIKSIIIPIMVICLINLFGEDSIEIFIYAILLNFFVCLVANVILVGFRIIPVTLKSAIAGDAIDPIARIFEVHDSSFAAGLLLLFTIFNKDIRNRKFIIVSLLLAIIFGQKRIEFGAIIVVLIIYGISKLAELGKMPKVIEYHLLEIIMVVSIILCIFYVWFSMSGGLEALLEAYGIDSNNRGTFYKTIANYATFSPTYLGIGRNSVYSILSTRYNFMTGNLHNDFLKLYVENGFVLFFSWLIFMLLFLPKYINRKFGYKTAIVCILYIIYLFILYTTDNTDTYFDVQCAFILCISVTCLRQKRGLK